MNKVVLISSYCDTQEKLDILEKNIDIIKKLSIDVIVISPFFLPEYIQNKCDYFFLTKDNLVLDWPIKSNIAWFRITYNNVSYGLNTTFPDYGFAGLNQIKQLGDIALSLNYKQFYPMIYDLKIDENVIEGFTSDKKCNLYPFKRGDDIQKVGLQFMIFDRVNLSKFISYITLENYLKDSAGYAETWLYSIKDDVSYEIEKIPVEDEIVFYGGDRFNQSPIEGLNFFIEKNDETKSSIKLLFYGNEGQKNIEIKVGENRLKYLVNNFEIIDLGFNELNHQQVVIIKDSIEYDITDIILKIKHNVLSVE
jgi:hypothetical protein